MTIRNKIFWGFIIFFLLFIFNSFSGYRGISIVSDSLNFVTGPAWDAADGAMEGTIGIQSEMITLQQHLLLRLNKDDALQQLSENTSFANEALQRMFESGLMESSDIGQIEKQLANFRSNSQSLVQAHTVFRKSHKEVNHLIDNIENILMKAEDSFEQSMDGGGITTLALDVVQSHWNVADDMMETRINLLRRARIYEEIITGVVTLDSSLQELDETLEGAKQEINILQQSTLGSVDL